MKKFLKIISIVFIFIIILAILAWVFYYLSFKTNSWLRYPDFLKRGIAVSRLEASAYYEPICHEECGYEREVANKVIIDCWAKNESMKNIVVRSILDEGTKISFRTDLVWLAKRAEKEMKKNNENHVIRPPKELVEYLKNPDGDMEIKRAIMDSFSDEIDMSSEFLDELIAKIEDKSLGIEVRIPAIRNLSSLIRIKEEGSGEKEGGPFPKYKDIDYVKIQEMFFDIAENESDIKLVHSAIFSLNYVNDFKEYYTEDVFNRIKSLLFENKHHGETEETLVLRLSYYRDINKWKTEQVMKEIYNSDEFTKFSRNHASDFLKEWGVGGYPEIEISDEEWDEKFENKKEIRY